MKIVLGEHVDLGIHTLQQLILHHGLRKLLLPLRHLVHALLLPKGGLCLLRLEVGPVEIAEPGVRLDLLDACFGAEPSNRGPDDQLINEIRSL